MALLRTHPSHYLNIVDELDRWEICCLAQDGGSDFYRLLFRRAAPYFCAFDLLALNGRDLTGLSLLERKACPVRLLQAVESRVLYLDHVAACGRDLFGPACERDLEGVVAKWAHGTYQTDGRSTSWLKIKNAQYSRMEGRRELFEASGGARRTFRAKPLLELRLA